LLQPLLLLLGQVNTTAIHGQTGILWNISRQNIALTYRRLPITRFNARSAPGGFLAASHNNKIVPT